MRLSLSAATLLLLGQALPAGELKVGGFGQVQFSDGSAPGNRLVCDVKRMRVTLKGDVTGKIGFYAQFDMLSAYSPLLDFVIDYDLGPAGRLGAGRFRRPFGLQHTFSTFDLNTVNYSRVVNEIVVSGSRDYGIRLAGERGPANWILAVVNRYYPPPYLPFTNDQDDGKNVVGRAGIEIMNGIEFGGSGFFARRSRLVPQEVKAGADFRFDRRGVLVQAEAIYGKTGSLLERAGGYVEVGYKIGGFQPIARYEIYDADTRGPTANEETVLAAGLNYFFTKDAVVRFIFEEHVDNLGSDGSDRDDDNICILQLGARI